MLFTYLARYQHVPIKYLAFTVSHNIHCDTELQSSFTLFCSSTLLCKRANVSTQEQYFHITSSLLTVGISTSVFFVLHIIPISVFIYTYTHSCIQVFTLTIRLFHTLIARHYSQKSWFLLLFFVVWVATPLSNHLECRTISSLFYSSAHCFDFA